MGEQNLARKETSAMEMRYKIVAELGSDKNDGDRIEVFEKLRRVNGGCVDAIRAMIDAQDQKKDKTKS